MDKPRLLIHSLIFPPDQVSTAYLYGDIARTFVEKGWEVDVFTTIPHYNVNDVDEIEYKKVYFGGRSSFFGARVRHFPQKKSSNFIVRSIYILAFHLGFIFRGLFGKSFDVVLTPSPPLTAGLISGFVARLRGAKSIYNVQEIYPDILIKSGKINNKILISLLFCMEKLTYRLSTEIVTIDEHFESVLKSRVIPDRLRVIPNFVDTSIYRKVPKSEIPEELLFEGKKLIGYVGNLGKVQDWDTLLYAMDILVEIDRSYHLLLVGGGSEFDYLLKEAAVRPNVDVWRYKRREWVPYIVNRCDVHVICMTEASEYDGLPSKIYSIMACGKPILAACSRDSPLAGALMKSKGGVVVPRGNPHELAKELSKNNYENYNSVSSVEYVKKLFAKEVVTVKFVRLAEEILSD